MADISLTASMRSNLLSLQSTQSLMDQTQERLSTGKKINSAIDNPSSYYTARSLTNRASDLNALLDSMGQGIQTIKAANEGIEAITSFVEQAKALINSALEVNASSAGEAPVASTGTFAADAGNEAAKTFTLTIDGGTAKTITFNNIGDDTTDPKTIETLASRIDAALKAEDASFSAVVKDGQIEINSTNYDKPFTIAGGNVNGLTIAGTRNAGDAPKTSNRADSQAQYNEILKQINQLASDSGYKGVNLLAGDKLTVIFNEGRTSSLEITGHEGDAAGLGLTEATDWDNADNAALNTAITQVDSAINTLRTWAGEFGNNYAILQSREDFTDNLVNVLTEGSDKLTLADMNEESANMLALQTRQQLAINSLSLASQAAQSVLKLF